MKRILAFMAPRPVPAGPPASGPDMNRRGFLVAFLGGVAVTAAGADALASPAGTPLTALPSSAELDGVASDYAFRLRIRWGQRRRAYRRRRSRSYGRRSWRRADRGRSRRGAAPAESLPGAPAPAQPGPAAPSPAPSPARPPRIRFN